MTPTYHGIKVYFEHVNSATFLFFSFFFILIEQPESLHRRPPPTPILIGSPSRSFTVTNTDSDDTALLMRASTQNYEEMMIADPKKLKEIVRDFDLPVS